MLWQENAVVHDLASENSIFTIFDMQFLPKMATFWQINAVVHDLSLFKIFVSKKIRAQLPFLANGWQLKRVVHDFHQFSLHQNAICSFLGNIKDPTREHAP